MARESLASEWLKDGSKGIELRIRLTKSEEYTENAGNCGQLAAEAKDQPSKNRYERMQQAWLALAGEQDWLDGISSKDR
jgi:hypothetical protein